MDIFRDIFANILLIYANKRILSRNIMTNILDIGVNISDIIQLKVYGTWFEYTIMLQISYATLCRPVYQWKSQLACCMCVWFIVRHKMAVFANFNWLIFHRNRTFLLISNIPPILAPPSLYFWNRFQRHLWHRTRWPFFVIASSAVFLFVSWMLIKMLLPSLQIKWELWFRDNRDICRKTK